MAFYVNVGYRFALPLTVRPTGSVILGSAMPLHQLQRRQFGPSRHHLATRVFDPQLYLATLDPAACRRHCAILASYPWFGAEGLPEYDSGMQTQVGWRRVAEQGVAAAWLRTPLSDPDAIQQAVGECIDFQTQLGCSSIIIPSPLTIDPTTDYTSELMWLDAALHYAREENPSDLPLFATVALSDICVRFADPMANPLLDLVLDTVSARGVDGAYIVLEQAAEPADTKHCGSSLPLASVLHLVHRFTHDAGVRVGVNFLGFFGLACEAAGAEFWACGWYKSLYRLRLADRMAEGRAVPTYWSYPAALDVNLDAEFDQLGRIGLIDGIADMTPASAGLLEAARDGISSNNVPAWRYARSNVAAAQEHFLISASNADGRFIAVDPPHRISSAATWLSTAAAHAANVAAALGPMGRTKTAHVQAWLDAFQSFRRSHNV